MEEERVSRMWWRLPSLKPEHVREGEIGVLHAPGNGLPCLKLRRGRAPSLLCLGNRNISQDTLDNAQGYGKESAFHWTLAGLEETLRVPNSPFQQTCPLTIPEKPASYTTYPLPAGLILLDEK